MDNILTVLIAIDLVAGLIAFLPILLPDSASKTNQNSKAKYILPALILISVGLTLVKEIHDSNEREQDNIDKKNAKLKAEEDRKARKRFEINQQNSNKIAQTRLDSIQKYSKEYQVYLDSILASEGVNLTATLSALGLKRNRKTGALEKDDALNASFVQLQNAVAALKERQDRTALTPALPINIYPKASRADITAKRPTQNRIDSDFKIPSIKELPEVDLAESDCKTNGINMNDCFGKFHIVSRFSEPIELYEIYSGGHHYDGSLLISPSEGEVTQRIQAGFHDNDGKCLGGGAEYKFYFRTTGANVKYGVMALTPHPCKIRTQVVSPQNLRLSPQGERYR